ncbi:two pore domain potassium channel family protein [Pseudonocardia sp. KRD-182]|uniref:potassium channel family protein n=1 Tax=Pseudonocardia oceani TaxID=2792013 RepID=UPI001C49F93B|nr:potassium channel family protein [Pseudonocardia oceani]MBW0108604.1 two pore domain potassium channel family protein [Pseudonocardia oceani]
MAAVLVGLGLVLLVTVDAVLTVLHPTRRGPLTLVTGAAVWTTARALARAVGRPGMLAGAGMLAVVAVFALWTALMWLGWALVYLPHLGDFSYDSSVPYGDRGMAEALYVSGMALTTVGYGDVVGATDLMRLATVTEAAAGFGLMTAAITYVLSIYPLTTDLRSAARMVETQADDPARAARLVVLGGASYLQDLQHELLTIDENTERFPFLYYFRAKDAAASLHTLMRGATMVCLAARWGVSPEAAPYARLHGDELQLRLQRIMDHYAVRFLMRTREPIGQPLDPDDAQSRLQRLVCAAGANGADPCQDDAELRAFALFVGRCQAFLDDLAEHHLQPPVQILGGS